MTKSSSSNWPFHRRTLSRPMCIGRSMNARPLRLRELFSAGPRSTVTAVTTATATATASVATARRQMTRVRWVSGCEKTATEGLQRHAGYSPFLLDHDEHGLRLDRGPFGHPHLARPFRPAARAARSPSSSPRPPPRPAAPSTACPAPPAPSRPGRASAPARARRRGRPHSCPPRRPRRRCADVRRPAGTTRPLTCTCQVPPVRAARTSHRSCGCPPAGRPPGRPPAATSARRHAPSTRATTRPSIVTRQASPSAATSTDRGCPPASTSNLTRAALPGARSLPPGPAHDRRAGGRAAGRTGCRRPWTASHSSPPPGAPPPWPRPLVSDRSGASKGSPRRECKSSSR